MRDLDQPNRILQGILTSTQYLADRLLIPLYVVIPRKSAIYIIRTTPETDDQIYGGCLPTLDET